MQYIKKIIIKMKGKRHYSILLCGLGCFIIGVICNIIHKSHHTNNYISIIHSTWYFILILLSCLCFAIAYSFYKDKAEWLYPFIDKRNLNMTFLTIGSILGIPIVGFIVGLIVDSICNCYIHHEIDNNDFVAHWSIFLSILSIFIGMKVYMRFIGDKDKHSFQEFIDILSDLFDNANPNSDNIYLLLPTIHIGAAGDNNKNFSKEFKHSIENFLNQNTIDHKLQLGILGYDKDGINKFIEKIKEKNEYNGIISNTSIQLDKLKELERNDKIYGLFVEMQNDLIENGTMPIFNFHSKWYKETDYRSKVYFYLDLALFLHKLEDYAKENKIEIYKIKEQYFNTWGNNENSDKGLFMFTNETKQKAYCGNIIINSQEHIEFQNLTIKRDTNLCTLFKTLFENFVTSNSQE